MEEAAGNSGGRESADELISAIVRKLEAKRAVLQQSPDYGRLTWRRRQNGELEVNLEPEL
jgi:hypothetical protein